MINFITRDEFGKIVSGFPLGLGTTNDIAGICKYLLSDDARWITGQNFFIDGGYSLKWFSGVNTRYHQTEYLPVFALKGDSRINKVRSS